MGKPADMISEELEEYRYWLNKIKNQDNSQGSYASRSKILAL